jgi:hypothetical protein
MPGAAWRALSVPPACLDCCTIFAADDDFHAAIQLTTA